MNARGPDSDLRIQLQTDPRYQELIPRAENRQILGYELLVAAVEDVLQGKLWAYQEGGAAVVARGCLSTGCYYPLPGTRGIHHSVGVDPGALAPRSGFLWTLGRAKPRRSAMRRTLVAVVSVIALAAGWFVIAGASADQGGTYKVTATAIEACSCPLFCSCYYNAEPTGGHMCRFNNAYRFEEGSHWGDVDLSGAMVWISGDLGGHFADGTTEWAMVTFDKATTPEQRAAIGAWAAKTFPVQWGKMEVREDEITWEEGEKTAHAKMASGQAEVTLHKVLDKSGQQATVTNTPYWGADSNTGFRLAHSDHYYKGDPSFEFEHRNGFLITITSEGALPAAEGP